MSFTNFSSRAGAINNLTEVLNMFNQRDRDYASPANNSSNFQELQPVRFNAPSSSNSVHSPANHYGLASNAIGGAPAYHISSPRNGLDYNSPPDRNYWNDPNAPSTAVPPRHFSAQRMNQPGSVVQEVRAMFRGSPSGTPRRSTAVGRSAVGSEQWNKAFYCLPFRDSKTPTGVEKIAHQSVGLGDKYVTAYVSSSGSQLENILRSRFPRLGNTHFYICTSTGTRGNGNFSVFPVNPDLRVPSVLEIKTMTGKKNLYILPDEDIIEEEELEEHVEENQSASTRRLRPSERGHGISGNQVSNGNSTMDEQELEEHREANQIASTSRSRPPVHGISAQGSNGNSATAAVQSVSNSAGGFEFRPNITVSASSSVSARADVLRSELKDLNHIEISDDIITMEQLRALISGAVPDQVIVAVTRNSLSELKRVYSGDLNLLKKVEIKFEGEIGVDAGALTKEYMYMHMQALKNDKFGSAAIFEGSTDHKLPSSNLNLVLSGLFRAVGKFFVHSMINTGIAFIGMSPGVVNYLMKDEGIDGDLLVVDDVPDIEIRDIYKKVLDWDMDDDYISRTLRPFLLQIGYEDSINNENSTAMLQYILLHEVIFKRKAALDAIKDVFRGFGLLKFLQSRPYLMGAIFVQEDQIKIPKDVFFRKLKLKFPGDEYYAIDTIKEFVNNSSDSDVVQKLIIAFTGFPALPTEDLIINYVDVGRQIQVHSCFSELDVPRSMPSAVLLQQLQHLVEAGYIGFGSS